MKTIADLLFEAAMLKQVPRSGYQFLGTGRESVAEHVFMTTFIAWVMAQSAPEVDAGRLTAMCLLHDLPETRTGDLNTVHKQYVCADEKKALADLAGPLPFGPALTELITEFNAGRTLEAALAHDADQLAFILDLKAQADMGRPLPAEWLPAVIGRLKTEIGKKIAAGIQATTWDAWWRKKIIDGFQTKP